MTIGENIRKLRTEHGFSLQAVADRCEVSKPHIFDIEKGKVKSPSVQLMARIAALFSVTIESLISGDIDDNIIDIRAWFAYSCDCGSVHFSLRQDGHIVCTGCDNKAGKHDLL